MNDERLQRLLTDAFTAPPGVRPTRNLFDVPEFERRYRHMRRVRRLVVAVPTTALVLTVLVLALALGDRGQQRSFVTASPGFVTNVELDQFDLIFDYRATNGIAPVAASRCLTDAAREWSLHMAASGFLHRADGKDGTGTVVHPDDPGLAGLVERHCTSEWTALDQNDALGFTNEGIFNALSVSESSRASILNLKYNLVGVGTYRDEHGRLWVTALFAECNGCDSGWTDPPHALSRAWRQVQ